MAKKFDALVLTLLTYILIFLWSRFFIGNIVWSLIFSSVLTFLIVLCARFVTTKIKKRPYSVERLSREFALRGNEYAADYLSKVFNNPFVKVNKNTLLCGDTLIICLFKFANVSSSDIATAYQTAKQADAKKAIVLCRGVDRPSTSLTVNLDVKFDIVKTGAVYRYLFKKNALPELSKEKFKFSLGYIFDITLKRQNAKFYIFSGLMLLFLSYFTPLKLYYLCFGTSLFVLAILCLSPLGHIGEEGKHKIFDAFADTSNKISDKESRENETEKNQKSDEENDKK